MGNAPLAGKCRECGCKTFGHSKKWAEFCPQHWQTLLKKGRKGLPKTYPDKKEI